MAISSKEYRDRLPTERQKRKFDELIMSGLRPADAYRIALWM